MTIKILSYTLDGDTPRNMPYGSRNQLLGCMRAHNELTFLNRLLMFSQTPLAEGELHDYAQSAQMWCLLQVLAGKLHETCDYAGETSFLCEANRPHCRRIVPGT